MNKHLDVSVVVWRFVVTCLLATTCEAVLAANRYWVPVHDGSAFSFSVTVDRTDSEGNTQSFGPSIDTTVFSAADLQVFDHRATIRGNGSTPFYASERSDGLFQISDGDPLAGEWFEYYTDPAPFFTKTLQDVGETIDYSGRWRGQWGDSVNGYQPWSGQWSVAITNLGLETITLPQGSFDAIRFQEVEHYDKSPDGIHVSRTTVTSQTWILEGSAVLMRTEDWLGESDYDGNDVIDAWSREHRVMVAVPEPEMWSLLALGGGMLMGVKRVGSRGRSASVSG